MKNKISEKIKISKNFYLDEFKCSCCDFDDIDLNLVEKIQKVRNKVGPIRISSACRCVSWNEKCGGKLNSAHTRGYALDLVCGNSRNRYNLILELVKEFNRIGISSDGFIHVDIDPSKDPNVCWLY